jgi:hypothetical protein
MVDRIHVAVYGLRSAVYAGLMFTWSSFGAVLVRPYLWPTAIGALVDFAPRRWWAQKPFLPIPDRTVMEWRVTTAYGHSDMTLAATDVVSYLRWRRVQ